MKLSDLYRTAGAFDPVKAATNAGLAALAYGALKPGSKVGEFITGKQQQPVGYTEGIPEYGINRTLLPDAFATTTPTGKPRIPGSGGRRYFSDTTYIPTGNTMSAAINPVNVPVTTTPRAPGGVFDALTDEEAQYFFKKLFSGQGISSSGAANTNVANTGAANTNVANTGTANTKVAGTNIANTGTANTNVANTGTANTKVDADAAKYNTLINQYLGGKTLTDKDFLTLRSSGYDVGKLATDLGIKPVGTATGADRLTGATQRAEAQAAATVADQIRQGNYTPTTAATKLNELYPGYNMSEESVVFELLNRGQTTPQEVAKYYADRGYAPEEVLARYQQLGGTRTFAQGGLASLPQSRGYYLGGATDGMADRIPATIENTEPAALSDGEFVIPADVVSHLGNGNSDAGAKQLYAMMDRIRQARTGRKEQGRNINPNKYLPT